MDSLTVVHSLAGYGAIRESILNGRLQPGERLVAQRIAAELGVSRTPVKEALARLEAEGLVVRVDNWGYQVRTISARDAEEIFEARLVIEVANADLSAQRATEAETAAMTKLLAASQRHLRSGRLGEFQNAARGVHERIAESTGNAQLVRMFRQVNDLVVLFGVSLLRAQPARADDIALENGAIVDAIQRRSAKEAAKLMRQHIERGHASFRAASTLIRASYAAT